KERGYFRGRAERGLLVAPLVCVVGGPARSSCLEFPALAAAAAGQRRSHHCTRGRSRQRRLPHNRLCSCACSRALGEESSSSPPPTGRDYFRRLFNFDERCCRFIAPLVETSIFSEERNPPKPRSRSLHPDLQKRRTSALSEHNVLIGIVGVVKKKINNFFKAASVLKRQLSFGYRFI
ncbi:unnamed protein product, partial [Ixodes persulcatus]